MNSFLLWLLFTYVGDHPLLILVVKSISPYQLNRTCIISDITKVIPRYCFSFFLSFYFSFTSIIKFVWCLEELSAFTLLIVLRSRSCYGSYLLLYTAILRNSLPSHIFPNPYNLPSFKSWIYRHLKSIDWVFKLLNHFTFFKLKFANSDKAILFYSIIFI